MRIVRYRRDGVTHVGVERDGVFRETGERETLPVLLDGDAGDDARAVHVLDGEALVLEPGAALLAPLDAPEVWCAGVTYERSRDARIGESAVRDVYQLVYDADRPELFLKDAAMRRTVGPGDPVGVRADATWNVPEPEIGLVLGVGGAVLGYTIGNDVSSRDIEGANPLYLPQAKVFAAACALGPAILVARGDVPTFAVVLRIVDGEGAELFAAETSTARMARSFDDLVAWLLRDNPVPPGSVLLTGTGLVPRDDFTLLPGHVVEIHVPGIGTLRNPVRLASELVERSP
jgi:2-dehydro-3-deoxy-D-arabinonate dehydratase